jgi:hypothetical protein
MHVALRRLVEGRADDLALGVAPEIGDLLGALVDQQDDELGLGLLAEIELAMFCSSTVLPVRGGATISPRWPKPTGVRMSTARIETSFWTSGASSRMRLSG